MFIPGFGALVRMKQYPATAQRGRARSASPGPIWGLAAAVGCFGLYLATGAAIWAAIAHVGRDDQPVQPDADLAAGRRPRVRGPEPHQRWLATGVTGAALLLTGEGLLVLIAILAAVQAFGEAPNAEGNRAALIQFAGLVIALGLLMKMPVPGLP